MFIELIVAMAVAAAIAAVGTVAYTGVLHRASDTRAAQTLAEIQTAIANFQYNSASLDVPTDPANVPGAANSGEPSYSALAQDLGAAQLLPAYALVFSSWSYQPGPTSPWASVQDGIAVSLTLGPGGAVTGTVGGVPVSGTLAGQTLSLTAGGATFASATYSCASGCQLQGTIAGVQVDALLGAPLENGAASMAVPQFGTHGAWVSSVANWANRNVPPGGRGQIVSGAARSRPTAPPADPYPATTYTITATAAGGTGATLCADSSHGVVILPPGTPPSNPGVSC